MVRKPQTAPTRTRIPRMERITIFLAPPRFGAGAGAGSATGSGFSTLNGLLISLPSVLLLGAGLRIGIRCWNQGADLAGGPRQLEARLGLVGQRVDARVAREGESVLGAVHLDRGGHAGLEPVARQLELVLGQLEVLAPHGHPAVGGLGTAEGPA